MSTTNFNSTFKVFKGAQALANLSLSKLLGQKINLRKMDMDILEVVPAQLFEDLPDDILIGNTDIFWKQKCANLFAISCEDAKILLENYLSPELVNDTLESSRQLKLGYMSEFVNVLVSSFLAELADSLELNIYGGVPDLIELKQDVLLRDLKQMFTLSEEVFVVNSVMTLTELGIEFRFIWFFNEEFYYQLEMQED